MNGVHDLGGMHGFGPIVHETNEPVFHETWEGRAWALWRAMTPWGRGRWGSTRYEMERIPAAEYLRMSYYERWFTVLVSRLLRTGIITDSELATGVSDPSRPKPAILDAPPGPGAARIDLLIRPAFRLGQRVRARNLHPEGHTRHPRYVRGRRGIIVRDNGVFGLLDTDADGKSLGGKPQHVYTVQFRSRELWGPQASTRDSVYVDLSEDYLQGA